MKSFSAYWSPELDQAIKETPHVQRGAMFTMKLVGKEEPRRCIEAVNQGIDAHLEACYIPTRGDRYVCYQNALECEVSPDSLPVLIRRLLEPGDEVGMGMASSICGVLGIELV